MLPYWPPWSPNDPTAIPRYEFRDGAIVFVDRHAGEWQILDFAGGHGWPLARCTIARTSRWTQYRLFVLLPNAIHGRLYHFVRGERRGFQSLDVAHMDGEWSRATLVDLPVSPLGSC